ncbi:hypothetical protein I546_2498 [Mycobacterium kansasii 732]|nr:hypothetical protein I546_2498 [Mycobacterium kansasii 732]
MKPGLRWPVLVGDLFELRSQPVNAFGGLSTKPIGIRHAEAAR